MERKKYWLILFFIFLNIYATPQSVFQPVIYNAFISGNMEEWKFAVDNMERNKIYNSDYLLELVNYQYGYIAWCLGNERKREAKTYLSLMEKNLDEIENILGETSDFHSYKAAAYGFKIGLNPWYAPILGPKSMEHAKKAIEKEKDNIQANLEMGNIWNHMPEIFGGSKEKALLYYLDALRLIESSDPKLPDNNWNYLNLLILVGQIQNKLGNREKASFYFKKALEIEPGFQWVKNKLLPSLDED